MLPARGIGASTGLPLCTSHSRSPRTAGEATTRQSQRPFSQLGWASGVFETYFAARDAYEIMTASDQIMTASSPDSRACQSLRRPGGGCHTRSYRSRLAALRSDPSSRDGYARRAGSYPRGYGSRGCPPPDSPSCEFWAVCSISRTDGQVSSISTAVSELSRSETMVSRGRFRST